MAHQGTHKSRVTKVEGYFKATYHKSQKYDKCPSCRSTKCVNYIKQMQRGMRCYTCARCIITFFTWGPKIRKPRPLRDGKGRRFVYRVDEMGEGND